MDDLVRRLSQPLYDASGEVSDAPEQAIDAIEALQAQLAEARDKALEDAAQCCEREADRCDDAAIWGGSRTYVNNCKAAAYAMRDRANAIRVLGNAAAAALAVEKKRADDATLTAGDEE